MISLIIDCFYSCLYIVDETHMIEHVDNLDMEDGLDTQMLERQLETSILFKNFSYKIRCKERFERFVSIVTVVAEHNYTYTYS